GRIDNDVECIRCVLALLPGGRGAVIYTETGNGFVVQKTPLGVFCDVLIYSVLYDMIKNQ
ncbi:hypothetical protein Q4R65_19155, partial [Morganella morganii]